MLLLEEVLEDDGVVVFLLDVDDDFGAGVVFFDVELEPEPVLDLLLLFDEEDEVVGFFLLLLDVVGEVDFFFELEDEVEVDLD